MKSLTQTYVIQAPIKKVWLALTNAKIIEAWGGGPAKMDDQAGTKFSLWGGSIWGINKTVIPDKKLVQDWYSEEDRKWEQPSIVTFTLTEDKNETTLKLHQTNIPDEYYGSIDEGWKEYYLGPLKEYLESE